jgi:membrane associated rhomboid family serine protease
VLELRQPDLPGLHDRDAGRVVTYVLIGICVLLFLPSAGQGGSRVITDLVLFGPFVADGEYWRLISSGFLHDPNLPRGFLHIGFNMYLLWLLGQMLEPSLGHGRFLALYLVSIVCGSLGALLLEPNSATLGASGGVFGLMGAAFLMQRARGIDPMQSGIGTLIIFNLALGFIIPNVSIGGHLGGLAGGAAAAFLMDWIAARRRGVAAPIAACVAIGAVAAVAAIAVAG